ncbi:hypothetical protein [Paraflavitalea speifideaquila]|uniref:hypothetical protein n=1 Tax=Paraflavitalea speifideaquila TaxID=3076558 RepID=UPI0028E4412B|nr:hypothetical protein [Paraflavitalea speifideiaquila]
MVSTRQNGRVNTSFADWRHFNKVLAYVTIGEKVYVLDATEKHTHSKLIPYEVMYSEGLVIEKIDTWEWGWRTLWDEKPHLRETIFLRANIDEKGLMQGEASVSSYDYSRVRRMPILKEGKDKLVEKFFTAGNTSLKVDSITLKNEEVDSLPLTQSIQFSQPINSSGDYKYFSINLFTGLEKNPFLADSRFSDVFLVPTSIINW